MIEHQLRTHIGLQGPLNQDRFVTNSGLVEVRSLGNCMRRIGNSSALLAILLAWGLSLICLPTDLMAAQPNLPGSVDRADSSSEPFGLSTTTTTTVTTGAVLEKWLSVERDVDDERLVLRMCEENRASCQSQAALQFLAIVDSGRRLEGRARLDGHWLTLDNRHMVLVEDHDVRRYRPIFLVDRDGVKAYSDAPSTFEASRGFERATGQIRR